MVKNYKCPDCGATLEYDPQSEKMHCAYCDNNYEPSEIGRQALSGAFDLCPEDARDSAREKPKLRMNIAVCNSCGGELAVSDVEVSSFCPYCGNASVVMDRVEERLAPDYVIPFKVTKEEAESTIRKYLKSGFCVPKDIRNFEVERLHGIYIPFWLYDIYYGSEQKWKCKISTGKYTSVPAYAYTLGDSVYQKLTVDASGGFLDDSSQRLEPYDMSELEPFNAAYLSGFYSDRYDVGYKEAEKTAIARAQDMFERSIGGLAKVPVESELMKETPVQKVIRREYAFLPVWFRTFRHNDVPYTILMNGQTKKMVGAVPTNKKKAIFLFSVLALALGTLFAFLGAFLAKFLWDVTKPERLEGKESISMYLALGLFAVLSIGFLLRNALAAYSSMKTSVELSRSRANYRLAKERQEKT